MRPVLSDDDWGTAYLRGRGEVAVQVAADLDGILAYAEAAVDDEYADRHFTLEQVIRRLGALRHGRLAVDIAGAP